jgi:cell wall-associated NlpC family hydrolase
MALAGRGTRNALRGSPAVEVKVMKYVVPPLSLFALLASAGDQTAQAQMRIPDVRLPSPEIRATIGPWSVKARAGAGGVDVSVGDRNGSSRSTRRNSGGSTRATATAARVIDTADGYVGTKYVWGGTTPEGFDCSGFVQYVFKRHGVQLPRTSRQQNGAGRRVASGLKGAQPGDLFLFATNGTRIDHVAIYVGANRIIHSSASGGGVRYDRLSTKRGKWFASHHVATRRVVEDGRSLVADLTAALAAIEELDKPDNAPPP